VYVYVYVCVVASSWCVALFIFIGASKYPCAFSL
jgi:hypothetical protein